MEQMLEENALEHRFPKITHGMAKELRLKMPLCALNTQTKYAAKKFERI